MKSIFDEQFAIIGAGNIGRMLLAQLRSMGIPANHIFICDSNPERVNSSTVPEGVKIIDLSSPNMCRASFWLICVGPKSVLTLLPKIAPWLIHGNIIISFAAAVPVQKIEENLPHGVSVVRVMPNMPSLIGQGINPVCFSQGVSEENRSLVIQLLKQLGETVEVSDDQMNWCVGLSGAAMRSVLPAMAGMIRAGMEAGLSEKDARLVAGQVFMGTAGLVKDTNLSFPDLKALTPMETLDESLIERLFYEAAESVKEKMARLQEKINWEND